MGRRKLLDEISIHVQADFATNPSVFETGSFPVLGESCLSTTDDCIANLRQHRTILSTVCLHIFRHSAQLSLVNGEMDGAQSVPSDEKSDCAIRCLEFCGIALNFPEGDFGNMSAYCYTISVLLDDRQVYERLIVDLSDNDKEVRHVVA